jgi:hypothetical protein
MFPTQNISTVTTTTTGKTADFDFTIGDFNIQDGKVVTLTGLEGLKIWVKKILRTEKNKFKIYNSNDISTYGVTLLDLVNSDYPIAFIQSQIQTSVIETLLTNGDITSVSNFTFSRNKRTLTTNFTINSIYGTISEGVTI